MSDVCRIHYLNPFFLLLIVMFFVGLVFSQPPTATLPAIWKLNQLDSHTYKFGGESTLRAIFLREVERVKYAFGFYCDGSGYLLSVLIIHFHAILDPEFTATFRPQVVWSANRNNLVTVNAVLELTDKGALILKDSENNSAVWSVGTSREPVASINLTDKGNLVLFDKNNVTVWQSFDHPTDTLLRGQKLMVGKKLVPSVSETNWMEQSQLSLALTTHGFHAVVGSKPQLSYYTFYAELSDDSYATMVNDSFSLFSNVSVIGEVKKVINSYKVEVSAHYIRLDYDGHLRAYGYDGLGWSLMVGDVLFLHTCEYPIPCGPYGICSNGQCTCPPPRGEVSDFNPVSYRKPELGCSRNVPLTCEHSDKQTFLEIRGITYFNFTADIKSIDETGCIEACAKSCSCEAAFFKCAWNNSYGGCLLVSELFSLINVDDASLRYHKYTVYIKVQSPADKAGSSSKIPGKKGKETFLQKAKQAGHGVAVPFVFLGSVALFLSWRKTHLNDEMEDDRIEEVPGIPIRFSYADLISITDDFSLKLGEGGFGAVFAGTLQDGTKVAVKRLDGCRHMKKSFLNEVGMIGSIHHINLVELLGFCAERSHRLLIYEYMSNGSLDKWIFWDTSRPPLDWQRKRDVILDVARGLHYLHEECKQKIAHLDIKPQNILLDDNLRGKISDFGLSSFVNRNNGQVLTTAVRGTPGYLAPEWLNGQITEKADVYSFGVVVLEVILGRRVFGMSSRDSDLLKVLEIKAKEGRLMDLIEGYSNDLMPDGNVGTDVLRVMRIAAWCLQTDFRKRPSMSTMIKVLDGVMEVEDDLVYDFTVYPTLTKPKSPETVLWPSILSGPR